MKKNVFLHMFLTLVIALVLPSSSGAKAQDRIPLGLGFEHVDVGKDLPGADPGVVFTMEYYFKLTHRFELNIGCGGSLDEVETQDASPLAYNSFWIGPRYTFKDEGIRPYLEAGFMKHKHTFLEDQSLSKVRGRGPYVTAGLIFPLGKYGYAINLYVKHSTWEGEDNDSFTKSRYDVNTTIVGVNLGPWILYLLGMGGY